MPSIDAQDSSVLDSTAVAIEDTQPVPLAANAAVMSEGSAPFKGEQIPDQSAPVMPLRGVFSRLAIISISHAAVDFISVILIPIIAVIEGRVGLTEKEGAILFGVGSIASGVIQPIAAWVTDKYNTRVIGPLGLLLGILAYSLLGWATEFWQVMIIQIIATAGIGAYHPVAAAAMGQLSAIRRSLGVSVFFVAGMVGHASGSMLVPQIVSAWGLRSLAWLVIPTIMIALLLVWAIHSISHLHHQSHPSVQMIHGKELRRRWYALANLYVGNVARFTVNIAVLLLLARLAEQFVMNESGASSLTEEMRKQASEASGIIMAAMIAGMAIGGLAAGTFVKSGKEKWPIVGCALLGAPCILGIPFASGFAVYLLAFGSGAGFASSVPLTLSVGQRLLPHRSSLASALMLGGAWCFAAVGPVAAQEVIDTYSLNMGFACTAGLLVLAGLLTIALPRDILHSTAHHAKK